METRPLTPRNAKTKAVWVGLGLLVASVGVFSLANSGNKAFLSKSAVREGLRAHGMQSTHTRTGSSSFSIRQHPNSIFGISRLHGGNAQSTTRVQSTSGIPDPNNADGFESNISPSIAEKVGAQLHLQQDHPLNIIKKKIEAYFDSMSGDNHKFKSFDDLDAYVSTQACFDDVLVPPDHVSRKISDTFYKSPTEVLRTHTSAHQTELLRKGERAFLVTGDCFRRDEIDASHYPVFHQMEGVKVFDPKDTPNLSVDMVVEDLKKHLEGMVKVIFGEVEMRWVDAYFPFTHHSMELEVFFNGDWLEVLGCGVMQEKILESSGIGPGKGEHMAWAFGMGLERLAMVLFEIPDIRLFWSKDARFLTQFEDGKITKFKPFSKYPPCYKDVSFWLPEKFEENDVFAMVRDEAGDLVEGVELIDQFTHPKTNRESRCYRINYRSMERSLTNEEVDDIQLRVRDKMTAYGADLR
eukprot:CAMPEP_0197539972 /NCGR_PEP_ID=MMETSP1318-20131121/64359_1 /TAXON_ID=552666 /ORGANISM="Partenskyella glossopodia, Strain RCC365" /LENGTH=465 /DNA_ID=CAMNT_0043098835 /DNA_START=60 /DNA_END=1457 /DNA_ORIENTATION=+